MARSRRSRTVVPRASSPAVVPQVSSPAAAPVGVAIAIAVAALYIPTAAHDIVLGDSPELTGTAIVLGVAHPPGYPIWTMLAHLFTLLPIDTPPFRVALFSVVAADVCVVLIYMTALRLSRDVIASACAALLVALVPAFWLWSVVPEVFALADAFAAALVLLLLLWHLEDRPLYFLAAAFVGGLGMAHQQTIALLAPAVLYLMWHHRRRFRGGVLFVRAAGASAAGLLPYLYLATAAARHTSWNWAELSSAGDVLGHILRVGYGTGALVSVTAFQGGSVLDRLIAFAESLSVPVVALAIAGLVALYRTDRAWFWFSVIAFTFSGPLFIAYSNINLAFPVLHAVIERFFLLPQVVLAPLAAVGVVAIAELGGRRLAPYVRVALTILAIAIGAVVALVRFPSIDHHADHVARDFGTDILSSARPNVIMLAAGDAVVGPVQYLQTIEGVRPDVSVVQMPLLYGDWYIRQLHREFPAMKITFDRLDGLRGTLRALVEANGFERFDVMGSLLDGSLGQTYALYRRGLVEELRQKPAVVDLEKFVAENDAALNGYRITTPNVPPRPWDRLILTDYALAASDVGDVYQRSKLYPQARDWYQRALVMYPDLAEAKAGLATLPAP